MAEVTVLRRVALALLFCTGAATAAPLQEALDAIKANDCGRLGEVLNRHLDASTAVQYVAGVIHEEGFCVDRDLERAARYYAAADARRDAAAARDIALEYLRGTALPRSYAKAGAWLAKMHAWRRDNAEPVQLPRSLVALPAPRIEPAAEWAGYLVGVGFVGSHTLQYPKDALRSGTEGAFVALVCVADGSANATTVKIEPGPIAGAASVRGRRQLLEAIEDNYASVMKALPPPSSPAPGGLCFRQPIAFRIR